MNSPTGTTRGDLLHRWLLLTISVAVLVLACGLQVRSDDRVIVPGISTPLPETCYFKLLSGWGCPGCGLTRSFISLAHRDFGRAWRFNPGGILCFAIVVFQLPYQSLQIWRRHRNLTEWRLTRTSAIVAVLVFIVLISQWIGHWFVRGV
jgi:hypothetical protein